MSQKIIPKLKPEQVDLILDKFTFSDKVRTNGKIRAEIKEEIKELEYLPFLLIVIKTWINYIVYAMVERDIKADKKWKDYWGTK